MVCFLETIEGVVVDLKDFQEIIENLICTLPAIGDLGMLPSVKSILEGPVGCDVAGSLKLFECLVNYLHPLWSKLTEYGIDKLTQLDDAVSVSVERAKYCLDV